MAVSLDDLYQNIPPPPYSLDKTSVPFFELFNLLWEIQSEPRDEPELNGRVKELCLENGIDKHRLLFEVVKTDQAAHCILTLLTCEASCNRTYGGVTALMQAIEMENTECALSLIKNSKSLNLNALSSVHETALMVAAKKGNHVVIQELIERGARVEAYDQSGNNALLLAITHDHTEIVRLLLAQEGISKSLNKVEGDGWTPLMLAAGHGHTKIVQLLLAQERISESLNKTNTNGWTPLMLAAHYGHTEAVQLLLAQEGISESLNKAEAGAWTPLMEATRQNHMEIVQLLLAQEGISESLNKAEADGWTPLMLAAHQNHIEILQRLLAQEGISESLNKANANGRTPLITAARHGRTRVVQLLLIAGAGKDKVDRRKAYKQAKTKGHSDILQLIRKKTLKP